MPESTRVRMQALLDKHRSEPHVTSDQYIRRLRIELGKSLDSRDRVYLDKRYWIIIRDVALGRNSERAAVDLLSHLRRLVAAGAIFCPISEALFVELLKQRDLYTRRATAELIDQLSLGITLAPEDERVGTELAHLFHSSRNPDAVYHRDWLVWTKLSYVLGMSHPSNTGFDTQTELVLQKAFVDQMWDTTLVEMVDMLGDAEPPSTVDFEAVADKLNEDCRNHAHEIRSFKQTYDNEIAGALSLYMERATDILAQLRERETGATTSLSPSQRKEQERLLHTFFTNAFRRGKLVKELPTLHVHAMCHAAFRWDKKRQFEGNDLFDFHHAAAALAYCDVFLTERPLQVLLTARHIELDKNLGCTVASDTGEAIVCLSRYDG